MLLRDIRYALRMLRRTPGFTVVAVLSLALGIGVNSAVFSLADALLLRPLPVPSPSEVLTISDTASDIPVGSLGNISYPDYVDLRGKSQSFDELVAGTYSPVGMAQQRDALPQLRLASTVSGNYFRALRVEPALGRSFSPEEDRVPGRDAVTVLGYDAWQQYFSGDPNVIGRHGRLNDIEFTVIGVVPKKFTGLNPLVTPDLYIPAMMLGRVSAPADSDILKRRDKRVFTVRGRLKPGSNMAQASAEMATIGSRLAAAYPDTNRNRSFAVRTEIQARVAQSPPNAAFSAMLLGIAGLVLIIACANVANLLLSRARSRSREMAVRLAIGAGRGRLLRQLLTESLILALAGAAAGLLLAEYGVSYFSNIRFASDLPISLSVRLDQRVLLFSLIAAVVSALAFGLAPAIGSTRTDLVPALKSGESNGGRRRTWGRNTLVIGQVALSLVLLSAAALFVRTFRAVITSNPGFRTDHLLMMSFDPTLAHNSAEQTREFYQTLPERARQIPGVKDAALSQMIPFDGVTVATKNVAPEGFQFPQGKESDSIFSSIVDDHFFEAMGMPIVRGRGFQPADTATSTRVAVINEAMASRYWPNRDAIGRRFRIGARNSPWIQVVGIAKNSVYLAYGEPRFTFLYLPLTQNPQPQMTLMVQSSGDAASLAEPLRNLVRSMDARQPVYNVRTMSEYYRHQGLQGLRLVVQVVGFTGLLGLVMALIGLYSLVAYWVSRRTREIGIRMAIGAERSDILRLVLRQGLTLALIGVALGMTGSLGVVRIIRTLFARLQEEGIFDPWTFIAVPLALLAVTILAGYIPARRAAAIDPNQALHYE